MKYTDTPPYAPTLMESTRAIGYLIESAIADIIDNSIAANATAKAAENPFKRDGYEFVSWNTKADGRSGLG